MTPDALFDRERAALTRLQKLVRDRAAAEKAVAAAFDAGTGEATREADKARKAVAAARKKATDDLGSGHQTRLTEITDRAEAAQAETDQARVTLRKKTVDQFSTALQKLRAEFDDKLWTVDSQAEAWDKQAVDAYQDAKRKAKAGRQHAAAGWAAAEPRLARVRLKRDDVAGDPAAAVVPAGEPLAAVQQAQADADAAAARLAAASLPKFTGVAALAGFVVLAGLLAVPLVFVLKMPLGAILAGVWAVVGGVFFWVLVGVLAKRQVRECGVALGAALAAVDRAADQLDGHADYTFDAKKKELADRHQAAKKKVEDFYRPRIAQGEKQLQSTLGKIDADHAEKTAQIDAAREADTRAVIATADRATAEALAKFDRELAAAEKKFAEKTAGESAVRDRGWKKLAAEWKGGLAEVTAAFRQLATVGDERFPPWDAFLSGSHPLPASVPDGIRYGSLAVDLAALPDGIPADARLLPAEAVKATLPAYLPFPDKCAVLVRAWDEGRGAAVGLLQALMLRFLTGLPPGKVRFTIVDPVGLGENFAAFMHLADYDEKLVTNRIWTEPGHIDKRLLDLTEHMENVIQKYLRNQYKSIEEYNRAAGEVAEPYRVLVVANFPTNFTPEAARRLVSIASSGPACGVCTLVSVDTRAPIPRDFRMADLEQVAFNLAWRENGFVPADPDLATFPLTIEKPPAAEAVADLVRKVGKASLDAARVEVPFEYITPAADQVWTFDASRSFEIPVGRAGATRRQIFTLGKGTSQHALIAGKTGSGKSTLLHALITNLALMYSPDEAELYLIDFKKGVEFRAYAANRLPHAKVVAIESEREFGLSVLQRLDGVLRERGDWYRHAGANDLAGYRAWLRENPGTPGHPRVCPRILLVVDEFQEFFVEDDKLSQEAALLMDRLVRQGRAFGVHVLLGSQTLGGAFSLARSTIDQMAVRVALQCSEADAQLILSKDNTAARLLNRPGEAIYNDANGRIEGNDPFQVVWLDEDEREQKLGELRERAAPLHIPPPLVFEGSSSADLGKNEILHRLIAAAPDQLPAGPVAAYLGDPVAIKDPTAAVFRPQSGSNLLLLGQHEEAALGLMTSSLVSLLARLRPTDRTVTIIDGTPDDSDYANFLRTAATTLGLTGAVADRGEMAAAIGELTAELARRQGGETADRSPRFLFVHGLHRVRELRKGDEDFGFGRKEKVASPGDQFATLIREGPPLGIHVVAWCDSLTNLQRAVDRQGLREFAQRVLFQMSASDSSHLIDSPAASRLGRHRALYVEEGTERPEKFRPYGPPPGSWLRKAADLPAAAAAGSA